jgi:hypothetical protein
MTEAKSTPAATPAEVAKPKGAHARLLGFCKHPASILVWFCLFSLIVQEQFPFSHYPMYSGWSSRTHYFYLADEDGPIPAKLVFKTSVPRTKKLYGGILDKVKKERGVEYSDLTEGDFAEAGRRLLKKLRGEAPASRRDKFGDIMDRELSLVRVEIIREKKKFRTEEHTVVTTGPDNQIVPAKPEP